MRTIVRGLTIIVAQPDGERMRAALTLAAANAALGARSRLFLQGEAVRLLDRPSAPRDAAHEAAGLPTVAALFDDALGLGVEIIACQSGLHLAGLTASDLDPRLGYAGPVGILRTLDEDRLLLA